MVTYLPTSTTRTITVVAPEYPTTLTLEAPAEVRADKDFTISGILYYTKDTMQYPLGGKTINLSYNGISLGSATTGVDGDYLATVRIPTVGTYVLTAKYAGEPYYSQAVASLIISTGRFPMLRTLFPRLFEKLDQLRGRFT